MTRGEENTNLMSLKERQQKSNLTEESFIKNYTYFQLNACFYDDKKIVKTNILPYQVKTLKVNNYKR